MREYRRFDWMELVEGILFVILGIYCFFNPGGMLTGAVVVGGIAAIVAGIADMLFYIRIDRHIGFGPTVSLVTGVLSVMTGFMLLVYPGAGLGIISILFPLWFLMHCVSRLSHLNRIRFWYGNFQYYFTLTVNIIGLFLGFFMLFSPGASLTTAGYLAGFYLVLLGLDSILTACGRRNSDW